MVQGGAVRAVDVSIGLVAAQLHSTLRVPHAHGAVLRWGAWEGEMGGGADKGEVSAVQW